MEVKIKGETEILYCVNSAKVPPMILPVAEPKARPDEKVANAKDRAREGGNA